MSMSDNTSSSSLEMEAGSSQTQENINETFPPNNTNNNTEDIPKLKLESTQLKSLAELASAKTNSVSDPTSTPSHSINNNNNNTTTSFGPIENAEPFQMQSTNGPPYEMDFDGMSPMKSNINSNLYAFSPSRLIVSPSFSSPFPSNTRTSFMSPIQDFSTTPSFNSSNSIPLSFDAPIISNPHIPHFPLSSVSDFPDTPPLPSTPVTPISDKTHPNMIGSLNSLHTLPTNPPTLLLPASLPANSLANGTHKRKRSIDEIPFPTTRSLNTSSETPSPTVTSPPQIAQPTTTKRKQCHCKNSKCLKLYCECFASRTFCQGCNCNGCMNNEANKEAVDHAVAIATERNPNAFKPKILGAENSSPIPSNGSAPSTKHSKGCHCKKSGCLKKYCECFQAGIQCSSNCKCTDCKNSEGSSGKDKSTPITNSLSSVSTPTLQSLDRSTSSLTTIISGDSNSNSKSNHGEASQQGSPGKKHKTKTKTSPTSSTVAVDQQVINPFIPSVQPPQGEAESEQVKAHSDSDVDMVTKTPIDQLGNAYESNGGGVTPNSERETGPRKTYQRETQAKFIAGILQPAFISEVCKTMLIAANQEKQKFMQYVTEDSNNNPPNLKSNSPTILKNISSTEQSPSHTLESNTSHTNTTTTSNTTPTISETRSLMCEEEVSSFTNSPLKNTGNPPNSNNSNNNNNNNNNNNDNSNNHFSLLGARLYASQEGVVLTDLNNLLKGLLDLTRKHQSQQQQLQISPEKVETNRFFVGSGPSNSYHILDDNNHS